MHAAWWTGWRWSHEVLDFCTMIIWRKFLLRWHSQPPFVSHDALKKRWNFVPEFQPIGQGHHIITCTRYHMSDVWYIFIAHTKHTQLLLRYGFQYLEYKLCSRQEKRHRGTLFHREIYVSTRMHSFWHLPTTIHRNNANHMTPTLLPWFLLVNCLFSWYNAATYTGH